MRTHVLTATALITMSCSMDIDINTSDDSTSADTSAGPVLMTTSTGNDTTVGAETLDWSTTGSADTTLGTAADSSGDSSSGDDTGSPPTSGYGDCADKPGSCLAPESCLYTGWSGVCSVQGCEDVSDCPPAPSESTATVDCRNVGGGGNSCLLDCSDGQMCPSGMFCLAFAGTNRYCDWPAAPTGGGQCPDIDLGSTVPQTFMGDTTGLGDDHFPLCGFQGGDDALIQFTAPADGAYTFNTFGSSFDTTLAVLDACPGDEATEIGCNDDATGVGPSEVTLDLTAGQSVVAVVDGYYDDSAGPFTLNITMANALAGLTDANEEIKERWWRPGVCGIVEHEAGCRTMWFGYGGYHCVCNWDEAAEPPWRP